MNSKVSDGHIDGNYGEDRFKGEDESKMRAYRKYMGPSGNSMSDHQLKKLAGWSSFESGWGAAVAWMNVGVDR